MNETDERSLESPRRLCIESDFHEYGIRLSEGREDVNYEVVEITRDRKSGEEMSDILCNTERVILLYFEKKMTQV